jgi:hypothetical protein
MANMRVDYNPNSINDAYHGTLYEVAKKIVSEKKFIPSKSNDDYLGDGVYFFEGSRWLAAKWVERNHGKDVYIGIVCACVNYGNCLNLNLPEHRFILNRVKEEIIKQPGFKKLGRRITDAFVVNYYATNINKYLDTIRLTYICQDYGKLYEGSIIYDYAQPMLCVRNHAKISNISLSFGGKDYV